MVLAGRRRRFHTKHSNTLSRLGPAAPAWVKRMIVSVLIAATCLAVTLSYLWIQAEINEAAAEKRSWQRALKKTVDEHEALQFELSALQSSSRIEQVAVNELGMAEPRLVIFVDPSLE